MNKPASVYGFLNFDRKIRDNYSESLRPSFYLSTQWDQSTATSTQLIGNENNFFFTFLMGWALTAVDRSRLSCSLND